MLIELKRQEAGYEDIGQMNMYLGYFGAEENTKGDNSPIGIILAGEKDELLIEYAVHGMSAQLFVQKYQLYLPNEAELRREMDMQIARQLLKAAATAAYLLHIDTAWADSLRQIATQLAPNQISPRTGAVQEWLLGDGTHARQGFTVDMRWKSGKLAALKVHSCYGGTCRIRCITAVPVIDGKGRTIASNRAGDVLTFRTQKGMDYIITPQ